MSARCGHVLDDGRECRRRVRVEGDRCHLHPWATIRPGTTVSGDVAVVMFGWDLASVDAEGVHVWLPERAALRLARNLYSFHDIVDAEIVEDDEDDEVEPWESS